MKVLIAEDDPFFCRILEQILSPQYELLVARDGAEAWSLLSLDPGPRLAVLDWVMPGMTGPQICRMARQTPALASMYLILLTARNSSADVIAGLRAGADDFVTKPVHQEELRTRVKVGERIVLLQSELAAKTAELAEALAITHELTSFLPICPECRRIRLDTDYWQHLDTYLSQHGAAAKTHATCPLCSGHIVGPQFQLVSGVSENAR